MQSITLQMNFTCRSRTLSPLEMILHKSGLLAGTGAQKEIHKKLSNIIENCIQYIRSSEFQSEFRSMFSEVNSIYSRLIQRIQHVQSFVQYIEVSFNIFKVDSIYSDCCLIFEVSFNVFWVHSIYSRFAQYVWSFVQHVRGALNMFEAIGSQNSPSSGVLLVTFILQSLQCRPSSENRQRT